MSERTEERTEDVSAEDVLDDFGGDVGGGADDLDDDVGLGDDELGVDVDALTSGPGETPSGSARAGAAATESNLIGRLTPSLSGLPNPLAAVPSGRSVLLSFVVALVMMGVVSVIPLTGFIPMLWAGAILAGAFTLGAASSEKRYFEFFLVGAVLGAGSVMGDFFRLAVLADIGLLPLGALGAGIGALAGLLGQYFGRDFRSGLTRDIE